MVATEQTGQRGIFKVWSLLSLFAAVWCAGQAVCFHSKGRRSQVCHCGLNASISRKGQAFPRSQGRILFYMVDMQKGVQISG